MKIKILVDNISNIPELKAEHGFSLLAENENARILFDTGVSENIIVNSEFFKIQLKNIDFLIISHNHYDHTGGMKFVKKYLSQKTKLIIGKDFFKEKYKKNKSDYRKISSDFMDANESSVFFEIRCVNNIMKISDNIFVLRLLNGKSILNDYFYIKDENECFIEDNFHEEIILVYKNTDGLTVISGCSHTGIENIIKTVNLFFYNERIMAIIGGLHLENTQDKYFFELTDMLKQYNIKLFPGHCTGESRLKQLKDILKDNCEIIEIGKEIIINHEII